MRRSVRTGTTVVLALGLLAVLPAIAADNAGDKVLVTRPGVVFHKAGAEDVRGRGVERTMDSALEAGYAPCPVCFAKEISAARDAKPALPGGAAIASSTESIPAPPVSTVTQPFGFRIASTRLIAHPGQGAIRNPYESLVTVVPGRKSQGAYGER